MDGIKQMMPCPTPLMACFYVEEKIGRVFRDPMILLALVQEGEDSYITPMAMDIDGYFMSPGEEPDFLGYEQGAEFDWTKEIEKVIARKAKVAQKRKADLEELRATEAKPVADRGARRDKNGSRSNS
jgi:hypothetical protein